MRKHVIVHGRVQGVGFRYAIQRTASSRNVSGWVRNLPDGTVEAVFQGDSDAVDSLVRFCEDGPRGAHVDGVEVVSEEHEPVDGFAIR